MRSLRLLPILALLLSACPGSDDASDDTAAHDASGESGAATTANDATSADGATSANDATTVDDGVITFSNEVWSILNPNCSCHTSGPGDGTPGVVGNPFLGTDPTNAYGVLVNQPSSVDGYVYIEPGSSANSYFYLKLTDAFLDVGGSGTPMPLGAPLSNEDIALIGDWIDAGAPL